MKQTKKQSKSCEIDWMYSLFIAVSGTLLHFLYKWSGENQIVALFSAVDESVFEHLKIFFVPAFLYSVFSVGKTRKISLWCQTQSILMGLLTIIIVFYTYTGITQKNIDWINIIIFYMAAIVSGRVVTCCSCTMLNQEKDVFAGVILLLLWAIFIWFTFQLPVVFIKWLPGLFLES